MVRILHLLILFVASSILIGCFNFPAPTEPEFVSLPCPMPDLPVVDNTPCPNGSNLEWCFDRDNTSKLKSRLTILYNVVKGCHL